MNDWVRNLLEVNSSALGQIDRDHRSALRRALDLHQEVEAFERNWPARTANEVAMPGFSWSQLERQLADLAGDPIKSAMARDLVSGTRKLSRFKPPEMVLREILCMTWALLDEGFQPDPESEAGETP
ncbi:hypothetical protein [Phenylobacterium aquaticum]|uniref:hypothetical protein n=1 Tax=Phenylobacterium aquaticum TaxID=1763816 RepID=UPI0026F15453|nr:hypothetical protein [Phenylobacterium aquaticum]